jgi:hypothetical protein
MRKTVNESIRDYEKILSVEVVPSLYSLKIAPARANCMMGHAMSSYDDVEMKGIEFLRANMQNLA